MESGGEDKSVEAVDDRGVPLSELEVAVVALLPRCLWRQRLPGPAGWPGPISSPGSKHISLG